MSLVERFIEVQGWRTSRRVAAVSAFVAVVALTNGLVGHVMFAPLPWVDLTYWDTMFLLFVGHSVSTALIALALDRRGLDGGWSFYLLALPFAVLMGAFVWGFGSVSTGLLVLLPLSLLTAMVFFDDRHGRISAAMFIGTAAVLVLLPVFDAFPYATALDTDDLRLVSSPRYAFVVAFIVLLTMVTVTTVALFLMAAGRLLSARLDAAQRLIARYVPEEVAQDILAGNLGDTHGHHRRKLTVFFSDLVGFSDVAEELEPEDLALVLNEYFGEMTAIAHRHHGTVDELQGDALLILFGAPRATTDREHALNAVRMAAEMHEAVPRLNARWRDAGITETLAVRMGINTGVVTIGNFGTPTRMKYAALGKHVNIAARLQAIAEPGTTVVSFATYLLVKDEVSCTALGPQQLKGITKPVEAYAL
ncbi:MAG TPA: adenylate/guanylate cyclase domain-containing protein [Nocardioidaceae bacterium]|nr:adenylate/guanylate cyclase domain-containing protein [Nocardioidaceae bacterium]